MELKEEKCVDIETKAKAFDILAKKINMEEDIEAKIDEIAEKWNKRFAPKFKVFHDINRWEVTLSHNSTYVTIDFKNEEYRAFYQKGGKEEVENAVFFFNKSLVVWYMELAKKYPKKFHLMKSQGKPLKG